MSEFPIAFELANMVPAPAAEAKPQVIFKTDDGVILCYGTQVDNTAGIYAKGCLLLDLANGIHYVNEGSIGSPAWVNLKS
jgi:hypothetical protein